MAKGAAESSVSGGCSRGVARSRLALCDRGRNLAAAGGAWVAPSVGVGDGGEGAEGARSPEVRARGAGRGPCGLAGHLGCGWPRRGWQVLAGKPFDQLPRLNRQWFPEAF